MQALWAPWRLEYILADKEDGCFICQAVEEQDDETSLVIRRGKRSLCILNRYPYNNGHVLIAPCRHEAELGGLSDEELLELMTMTRDVQAALQRAMSPHGFNVGLNLGQTAGAGLPAHLHVHLVPRWESDTNFMPVIADTKVIPQALAELYQMLKGSLE